MNMLISYKEFSEDRPKESKIKRVFLYVLTSILHFMFLMVVISFSNHVKSNNKYPKSRYRKVIKEGIFFDTYEYHERD